MKRYSIIRSFCVLVTLSWCMISCDGFLKESPRDALPEEEGYRNITELYLNAVASLYNYIGGNSDSQGLQGTGRGIYDLNTFTTDEAIMPTRGGDWYDGGFWQGLFLHKWGINNDAIQATWEYLYKVVMLSNKSLEQIESYALTHADAELPAYRAEVRALRAMYYYYLTDLFGSIPLVLSSKVASKDIVLSEREDIFNFIFKELQEVTPLLPAQFSNRSGNYYGRLTRPVAYFLLAKLALNAEIYMDNNWVDDTHPDGKTIFFDVDGTLTDAQGRIPDRTVSVLEYMAKRLPLYLSTALPVSHAKKRLGNVFGLFSGGVFADGGLLCYGETIECVPIANPMTAGFPGCRVTRYTREGKVFKYAVLAPNTREAVRWLTELDEEAYQLYQEGRLLTVVDSKAGKKNGLITLCARLGISLREVLVVGNTMHDWPMMSVAGYSCAVMDAEEKLRKLSGYVLNPDSIPVFFDI